MCCDYEISYCVPRGMHGFRDQGTRGRRKGIGLEGVVGQTGYRMLQSLSTEHIGTSKEYFTQPTTQITLRWDLVWGRGWWHGG